MVLGIPHVLDVYSAAEDKLGVKTTGHSFRIHVAGSLSASDEYAALNFVSITQFKIPTYPGVTLPTFRKWTTNAWWSSVKAFAMFSKCIPVLELDVAQRTLKCVEAFDMLLELIPFTELSIAMLCLCAYVSFDFYFLHLVAT